MRLDRKIKYFMKYVLFPKRFLNLALVLISRKLKLTNVRGYPLTIMIEPTNICNLKCPLCPTGMGLVKRKKGFLDFKNFKKIIDELGDYAIHLRLWNWGEPLLNKEIFEMISYAKRKRIFINLSTNISFIDKEIAKKLVLSGLDELIISLDGASEETYSKYRNGGDFKKAIEAIKYLAEEKKLLKRDNPFLRLQFIIMKHNEHEVEKIKKLADEIGINEIAFKTVGIMDYSSKEDIKKYLPSQEKYSRYAVGNKGVHSKVPVRNWCDFIWDEIVINWDGAVVPCCFDMNNLFVMGNAFSQNAREIWNNPEYAAFRKRILSEKRKMNLCMNCPGSNKETFVKV